MIAADRPMQRPSNARLLTVDTQGRRVHAIYRDRVSSTRFDREMSIVANDAATLPASLRAVHVANRGGRSKCGWPARDSLDPDDVQRFDCSRVRCWRSSTADRRSRAAAEAACMAIMLQFGTITAVIVRCSIIHDSCAEIRCRRLRAFGECSRSDGRPIQYAHVHEPLKLWDVWTPIAALPVAYEPPSAGFRARLANVAASCARRVRSFVTLTHAAGISSTGDAELDRRLPFDEPYVIPRSTADAIDGCAKPSASGDCDRHDRRAGARACCLFRWRSLAADRASPISASDLRRGCG